MIVNDIFTCAVALCDYMDAGAIDTTNTSDFLGRTPSLVNLYQSQLMKTGLARTKYEVSYSPLNNLLGDMFDLYEHDTEEIYEASDVALEYYFECDGSSGTVYIEDYTGAWNVIKTVTLANTTLGMMPYKSLVTPTTGATKSRIRFSGTSHYRYTNVGLFKEAIATAARMFDYGRAVKITLPTTVQSIKEVVCESACGYQTVPDSKIEIDGTTLSLFINRDFKGKIRVIYIPNPTKVTAVTDAVQLDEYSANIMAYMLADDFMMFCGREDIALVMRNKAKELIAMSPYNRPSPITKIRNVYGGF